MKEPTKVNPADAAPTGTDAANEATMPSGDIVNETTAKQPNKPDAPPQVIGQTPGETPSPIFPDPEPAKKGERQVKVVLDTDYWPDENDRKLNGDTFKDDDRARSGSAIKVSATKAKELIAKGKAHIQVED